MPSTEHLDPSVPASTFSLSELIEAASTDAPVYHGDGSTTIYVRLFPVERYSILPQPVRKSRRAKLGLTGRANVRRIARRSTNQA